MFFKNLIFFEHQMVYLGGVIQSHIEISWYDFGPI